MIGEKVAWTSAILDAMAHGRSVVTLESTVIAQGLPWPANLDTARAWSGRREAGAEPATIAVLRASSGSAWPIQIWSKSPTQPRQRWERIATRGRMTARM